jgi:phosphoribosylglycinamide formyltransferase-1
MAKPATSAVALSKISEMCVALPESARETMGRHAAFAVRGKKFAYLLDNHHGDGILALCFRGVPGEQQTWIDLDPERYYRPAYIGAQGWVGLRLDVAGVNWPEVKARVTQSYRLAAPKSLVAKLPANKRN